MTDELDDERLTHFMNTFYGYSTHKAKYWLIGMEEAGGNTRDEVALRLAAWKQLGQHELEDVAVYHEKIGMPHFFNDRPVVGRTWAKLIRILVAASGTVATPSDIQAFQKADLARNTSDNALIELLPLPSPGVDAWYYADYSQLSILKSREAYKNYYLPRRAAHIQAMIEVHQPKVVIFYGTTYMGWWQEISQATFETINIGRKRAYISDQDDCLFVVTVHPNNEWSNNYFDTVGHIIRSRLQSA